jgi:hypothetical protein
MQFFITSLVLILLFIWSVSFYFEYQVHLFKKKDKGYKLYASVAWLALSVFFILTVFISNWSIQVSNLSIHKIWSLFPFVLGAIATLIFKRKSIQENMALLKELQKESK